MLVCLSSLVLREVLTRSSLPGPNTRPCSREFLKAVLSDFGVLKNLYIILEHNPRFRDLAPCLEKVTHECERLLDNPALFAKDEERIEFFQHVQRYTAEVINRSEQKEALANEVKAAMESSKAKTRPSFKSDLNPWNQFLNQDAPGCGNGLRPDPKFVTKQILTLPAQILLNTWSDKTNSVREAIRKVSRPDLSSQGSEWRSDRR